MLAEVLLPAGESPYVPLLAGAADSELTSRANAAWRRALEEFTPPARDPSVLEALEDYVQRRTAAGGSPPLT